MKKRTKLPPAPEEELLKNYKKKLMGEAFLKSFMIGLVGGFLLSIPVSVISFITVYNTLWIALLVFGAGTVGFTLLSYFRYYRTNLRKTALRVDGVGLEERMITMVEYADKDDAIARRQRADAIQALKYVNVKQVKIPFPKTPFIALLLTAVVGICLMVTSTVNVVTASKNPLPDDDSPIETPVETEEEKIIREMIEELRRIIDEAKVKIEVKEKLHGMVDDLEARLRPEDSTEVKIAKISETAQKIHKILQEELSKTTIADELQKHDTTKKLGKAIESADMTKIEAAFRDMYDSITPLALAQKYEVLQQTADDILQSLEDATISPEEDALAKALKDLAQAMLDAIQIPPPPPDTGGEEDKVSDEIDQALQDAMDSAMDAIRDALEEQKEIEGTDQAIQDTMTDAMDKLGEEGNTDSEDPNENPSQGEDGDEQDPDESGVAHPDEEGDPAYWTVIDGQTPYTEVYKSYYEWALDMLTNGNLTDSERRIIENYLSILNIDGEE